MQVYELGWSAFFPVRRTRGTDRASSARTSCRSDNSVPANQEIGEQPEAGSVRTGSGWPEADGRRAGAVAARSEEHTSELQSLMRNSYAVLCLKKKITHSDTRKYDQYKHP